MRAIISFLCLLFAGCFTVSQLQSPKVLEMGKLEFNGGVAIARFEDFGPNELFGGIRVGVGSNTDIGFRIYGWLPRKGEGGLAGAGVYVDAKYQFTEKPPYVSGVLGLSYLTLQPALIVGTDRFYASVGAVLILIPSLNSRDEFSGVAGLAKLAVGYSFGSKFKLTPEIGAIFPITEGEFPGSPYYTAFGISIRP
jgi:hypothetical protein